MVRGMGTTRHGKPGVSRCTEGWARRLALGLSALAERCVPSIPILVRAAPPSGAGGKQRRDLCPLAGPPASEPLGDLRKEVLPAVTPRGAGLIAKGLKGRM